MTRVAATEFVRNFGRYSELAQRAAVPVAAGDFDDELVAALSTTRMDDRHLPLNALMD